MILGMSVGAFTVLHVVITLVAIGSELIVVGGIFAAAGQDGITPTIRSTYDAAVKYARLDIVALDGTAFIARKDDPGVCPGGGWQLTSTRGKPGIKGPPGERGERGGKGDPGAAAPTILAWKIDRVNYLVTPIMSDASEVPAIEMRGLFEQFHDERG